MGPITDVERGDGERLNAQKGGTVSEEGWSTQGLGHGISWVVLGGDIFQVDVTILHGLTNEMPLNADVAGAQGCLRGCGNRQTGIVVFANDSGARRRMASSVRSIRR